MEARILIACAATLVAGSLMNSVSFAVPLGANITISDRVYTGTGWYSNREDQETEPGTVTTQTWDLEGFYLSGSQLTMVGGFDFKNGVWHGGDFYGSGDIFVDIDGDAVFGPPAEGTGSGNGPTMNRFGYEYAIRLNFPSMTYSVFQLTAGSTVLTTVGENINQESNPWRYDQGGTLLAGYENLALTYSSGLSDAAVGGLLGGTHNLLTVDLSFASGSDVTTHFTMACGNDNLMGSTHVPEAGSTILYLFCGVAGLFVVYARFQRSVVRFAPIRERVDQRARKP